MRDDFEGDADVDAPEAAGIVEEALEQAPDDALDVLAHAYDDIDFSVLRKAIDCWKQGMVDREVSEELGIPMVYISSMRKFLGLKPNWKHTSTRTRRVAAKAMQKENLPVSEIAKVLKVHASLVRTWLETEEE